MNRNTSLIFLLLLSVLGKSASAQVSIADQLLRHQRILPHEKVYLHLDKPHYRLGESIWFKAYHVNASTHQAESKSRVLWVELIDQEDNVVASRMLEIKEGATHGEFDLNSSMPSGLYTIRAYTKWMRNFDPSFYFNTSISIYPSKGLTKMEKLSPPEKEEIILGFFPEGGQLVDGIPTTIGLKAVNRNGMGIKVSGIVVDEKGETVTAFSTSNLGFGSIDITPETSNRYIARISTNISEESFPMPAVQTKGFSMSVVNTFDSDQLLVRAQSKGTNLLNSTMVIHQRGKILGNYSHSTPENIFEFSIEKNGIDPGVCHITLFDANNAPVAERLVAINLAKNKNSVTINADSLINQFPIEFSIKDEIGNPLAGNVSVSITKFGGFNYSKGGTIQNYLLLSSDLSRNVENPEFYFQPTQESFDALDQLMLTHGWRRFEWKDVLTETVPIASHMAETSASITGQVVDFYNRTKSRVGSVSLSALGVPKLKAVETNDDGEFIMDGLDFKDTTDLILKAHRWIGKKGKIKDDVFLKVDKFESPEVVRSDNWASSAQLYSSSSPVTIDTTDAILLEEVTVKAKLNRETKKDPFARAKGMYQRPSIRIVADSILQRSAARSVSDYLRNIPNVEIGGSTLAPFVRLKGVSGTLRLQPNADPDAVAPLYLLDGVPTSESSVMSLNPFDISYIDILRGNDATMFGIRGSNGIIAVYLRLKEEPRPSSTPGSMVVRFPGYYKARKFSFSDFMKNKVDSDGLVGTTVQWEPYLISPDGTIRLKLKNVDIPGSYFLRMEGMAKNGTPIFLEQSLKVDE